MILLLFSLFLLWSSPGHADDDLDVRARAARLRVQAQLATGDWNAAEKQLRELLALSPEDRYLRADLAFVHRQQGRLDEAVEQYRRLLAEYPGEPSYRSDLIYTLFEAGRYGEVVDLFDAVAESPTGELRRLLADALDRTGQSERADRFYDAALADAPDDVPLLLMMGERQLTRGKTARARAYLSKAYALRPRDPRVLKGLALSVQESDPEQYRQYLLPILVLDRSDVEAPYLLGEYYHPTAPERAAKYYAEALKRLARIEHPDTYRQSLGARLHYRLGQRQQAESEFRVLLAANPRSIDLRNDLAQLLIEEDRAAEALQLLAETPTDTRSSWLRVAAYQRQGAWEELADELTFLAAEAPENSSLHLDLADVLSRTHRWPEALAICDSLLAFSGSPPTAERAFELRHALRRDRGGALLLESTYTGLPDERSWGMRPSLRWPLTPRLQATAGVISGRYRDDALPQSPSFSKEVREGWLELTGYPRPEWNLSLRGRGYLTDVGQRLGLGLTSRYRLRTGGSLELTGGIGDLWTEPVDAVAHGGISNRVDLTLSTPLPARLYLQTSLNWRRFRLRDRHFGDERRGYISLSRELLLRPAGTGLPLRSVSLSLSAELSRTEQEPFGLALFQLQPETRVISLGLFSHFLFGRRALLDLSLSAGVDPERDLGPGDFYGLGGEFHLDLNRALSFYAGGAFASESSLQAEGGRYRQARAGIVRYFGYFR